MLISEVIHCLWAHLQIILSLISIIVDCCHNKKRNFTKLLIKQAVSKMHEEGEKTWQISTTSHLHFSE